MTEPIVEELVNPNLHVALVHFPLGLLVVGTVIEVFSFFYRRSGVRAAGRWMILIGALSTLPVALSGMYALMDVTQMGNPQVDGAWADVVASSPLQGDARAMIERHAWVMAGAAVVSLFVVLTYLSSSDQWRNKLYPILLLMLVGAVGAAGFGAWVAGESVYMLRTGVTLPGMGVEKQPGLTFFLPPEQIHLILAGTTMALLMLAYAVTLRRLTGIVETAPPAAAEPTDPMAMLRSISPDSVFSRVDVPPAERFWVLAAVVGVTTALAGWWILASESDAWRVATESHQSVLKYLWDMVRPRPGEMINRRFAHLLLGGTIAVLPLVLAGLAHWRPRRRGTITLLSGLLLAIMAGQIWLGSLLLLDSIDGSVLRFNRAGEVTPTETDVKTPVGVKKGAEASPAAAPVTAPATPAPLMPAAPGSAPAVTQPGK